MLYSRYSLRQILIFLCTLNSIVKKLLRLDIVGVKHVIIYVYVYNYTTYIYTYISFLA